eukprot:8337392-Ditylum_brightwellii.AAC.1
MLPSAVLHELQTHLPLVLFPSFGARRVAPVVDDGTTLPWSGWQWDNGVLLWIVLGGLGIHNGITSVVFGWTGLVTDNTDGSNNDNDT